MFGDLFDPVHLILLLVVALLVFGPKRLPEVGKGLGETLREFRKAMRVHDAENNEATMIETSGSATVDTSAPAQPDQ